MSGAKLAAAPAVIVQAAMRVSSLGLEVGEVGCRDSSVVADYVPTRRPTVLFGMSAWRCRSCLSRGASGGGACPESATRQHTLQFTGSYLWITLEIRLCFLPAGLERGEDD